MFLGCKLTQLTGDTGWKRTRFNYMCWTIRRAMKGKAGLQ